MMILPAIDLFGGQAVRLYKGDFNQMTVYDKDPLNTVRCFEAAGATHLHLVDLEGAKSGKNPNLPVIRRILEQTGLFVEVGGGIRSLETVKTYLSAGVSRVILGTAAVTQTGFVSDCVRNFGDKIAVGIDVKDDKVAINGWQNTTRYTCDEFCQEMQDLGVATIICTDIAKDGVMGGTNRDLYSRLTAKFSMQIIASGGISTLDDVDALRDSGVYGAIIGKAYYTGAIDLASAIARAGGLS